MFSQKVSSRHLTSTAIVIAIAAASLNAFWGGVNSPAKMEIAALGNYPNTSVPLGSNATITPDAAPTNTTSINVETATGFVGELTADLVTGVVRVTNAHHANIAPGSYIVRIGAFGPGGTTATKTFQLTVTDGSACAGVATFTDGANMGVGSNPLSVAGGDFNNDGKQDIAVPNVNATTVSIRLGDGLGGFSGTTNVPVNSGPVSVTVGDFNNDGRQDIASANSIANTVSIRIGDGLGGFTGTTEVAAGSMPVSVADGDFNDDGKRDIAVANYTSSNVSIRLGDGLGALTGTTNVSVGGNPNSVAIGDFNNDGKQDFATANDNFPGTVSIRLGDGLGAFSGTTNVSVESNPVSVAVGDFNNDGKQDIAAANFNSDTVSIRIGDGLGGFSGTTNVGVGFGPNSMAIGDFNNDSKQDLAAVNYKSNTVSIRLGDGLGSFSGTTEVGASSAPSGIAIGDFNADGRQDFAVVNRNSNEVLIRLGACIIPTPTNTPTATPTAPPATCSLSEGFTDITTLPAAGWVQTNNSQPGPGSSGWFQGDPSAFPAQSPSPVASPTPTNAAYISADFNNGTGVSTLSNWLITPPLQLANGAQFTFWTRTATPVQFGDRLQIRMSTNGASSNVGTTATDVGDFTTPLLDINPTYLTTGVGSYPVAWTQFTAIVSGLGSPVNGRIAFRYFVETGGPSGTRSDVIGIDTVSYICNPTTTPTNTSTATPSITSTSTPTATRTNTSTATATATFTPTATITATFTPTNTATPSPTSTGGCGPGCISGTVTYGNAAAPPKYIANAAVASSVGSPSVSAFTDTQGTYTLTGFATGTYTIGATKTNGQNGISSNDAARVAQHVAGTNLFTTNNQKVSGDVSNNGILSSNDAAQIARFVAGLGPPIGLTNQWRFFAFDPTFPIGTSLTTRSYSISGPFEYTNEDYVGLLIGEVTGNWIPSAARPDNDRELAVGSGSIIVELPNLVPHPNKEILIPLSVREIADKGIISYEFDLRYDPAVIQPLTNPVDVAGTVSRGLVVVTNDKEPGLLRVVVYGAMPIDENGVLLNLKFQAVQESGVSPLVIEQLMFNESEQAIITNGQVEIGRNAQEF